MKNRIIIKRYAQGFVNSVKDKQEFTVLYKQLTAFENLLSAQEEVKDALTSRFLTVTKKKEIAEQILEKMEMEKKVLRFILLLVQNNRLELFSAIWKSLPDVWDETKGISVFEVFSVVPLTDKQKQKLTEKLEYLEKKPVSLKYKIDPTLIGGLSVKKGNVIYDISIKGNLMRLKELMSEG
ncbi:MAG: ATP synthase F1 subunit delta [Candidatus Aminicenantes bacterium]|nr:ATP synthase F1 subunit delta [Candidatus Aminicenantes bacterium]